MKLPKLVLLASVLVVLLQTSLAARRHITGAKRAKFLEPRPNALHNLTRTTLSPIVGGKRATFSTYRHLALIIVAIGEDLFGCTGTVIGRKWILTAAHCVDGPGNEDIDLFYSFIFIAQRRANPPNSVPFYDLDAVYTHKGYRADRENEPNDVALIKLKKKIPKSKYFPVTLTSPPKPKTRIVAAGFGNLDGDGREAKFAMQVNLLSQSLRTCRSTEPAWFRSLIKYRLHVCASALGFPNKGGQDTCVGDSGGPLFRVSKGKKLIQYAITSFGPVDCGAAGSVGYYTRVITYKSNILKIVKSGGSVSGTKFKLFKSE